jgi:metal-responsive CopG/Arc/MetJ family transcriptional regulator
MENTAGLLYTAGMKISYPQQKAYRLDMFASRELLDDLTLLGHALGMNRSELIRQTMIEKLVEHAGLLEGKLKGVISE